MTKMNTFHGFASISKPSLYIFLFLLIVTGRSWAAGSLNREDTIRRAWDAQLEQLTTVYDSKNENEGHSDLNWHILADNTGSGEPMSDWMFNGSAYFEFGPASKDPLLSLLNERLKAYNEDRGKDGPHVFFLITGGIYFLKDKFTAKAVDDLKDGKGQYAFDKAGVLKLGDLTVDAAQFSQDRMRHPELVWNTLNQLSQRGYNNTIVYAINLMEFLQISDIPPGTTRTWKDIEAAGKSRILKYETYNRGKGFKDKALMKRIVDKSRQDLLKPNLRGKDAVFAYLSTMIDNLIKAIHTEYDNSKESTNDRNLTDCGTLSDFRKTWPVKDEIYEAAVESMADLYVNHNDAAHQLLLSKHMIADTPGRFAVLPDNDKNFDKEFFVGGEWQDKLDLLPKYNQRAFEIDIILSKLDFFIPEGEARTKFAEDVSLAIFKKSGTGGGDKVLIVIPYYLCGDNPLSTPLLMGAAYTDDEKLNKTVGDAFVSRRGIRWVMQDIFRAVPKKHITYTFKVLYTGQLITEVVETNDDVSGFIDFADVVVLIDQRANKMQSYLLSNCEEVYAMQANYHDSKTDGSMQDIRNNAPKFYAECIDTRIAAVHRIVNGSPVTEYDVLTQDGSNISSNLIQSKLLGDDGWILARDYALAAIHRAKLIFFTQNSASKKVELDYGTMTDDLFYNKENPFHKAHWLIAPIDAVVTVASMLPVVGEAASAAGAVFYVIIGDNKAAVEMAACVIVPAILVKGAKAIKGIRFVHELSEAAANGLKSGGKRIWRVFVKGSTEEVKDALIIATDLVKSPADDLLKATGFIYNDACIDIIRIQNPELGAKLEQNLFEVVDGEIKIRADIPPDAYNDIQRYLNDPRVLQLYEGELKRGSDADFLMFIKTLENDIAEIDRLLYRGRNFTNANEMLVRTGGVKWHEIAERRMTLAPEAIKNGKVYCRINGQIRAFTPQDIAALVEQNGLRSDETLLLCLPDPTIGSEATAAEANNVKQLFASNNKELPDFVKNLKAELGDQQVVYIKREGIYVDKTDGTFGDLTGQLRGNEFIPIPAKDIAVLGERNHYLLCKKNIHFSASDSHKYFFIEGFTADGKIAVYRPEHAVSDRGNMIVEGLTAGEFYDQELKFLLSDNLGNDPVRIVSVNGDVDPALAKKFMNDLDAKSKIKNEFEDRARAVSGQPPISGRPVKVEVAGTTVPDNGNVPDIAAWITNPTDLSSVPLTVKWSDESIEVSAKMAGEGQSEVVGSAKLKDGWIDDPLLNVKKGTDGERIAVGEEVWDRMYAELQAKNEGHPIKGIRCTLTDDNAATFNAKLREFRSNGVSREQAPELAVWETHMGKMAKKKGFTKIDGPIEGNSSVSVTFVPESGLAVHTEDPVVADAFKVIQKNSDALEFVGASRLPGKYTSLSDNEEAILRYFAAEGNHKVNDALIAKITTDIIDAEKTIINSALNKLPKYKGGVVYRGAGSAESKANARILDRGATVLEFDQFLYTSKNADKAAAYMTAGGDQGYMMYEITPKTAVDISDISPTSAAWEELVSPTNTKYRVVKRIEKSINGNAVDYVYLEEL